VEKIEDEIVLMKHRLDKIQTKLEEVLSAVNKLMIASPSNSPILPKYVDGKGLKTILPVISDDTIKTMRQSGDLIFKKMSGKYYYPVEQFTLSTLLKENTKKEEKKKLRIDV